MSGKLSNLQVISDDMFRKRFSDPGLNHKLRNVKSLTNKFDKINFTLLFISWTY